MARRSISEIQNGYSPTYMKNSRGKLMAKGYRSLSRQELLASLSSNGRTPRISSISKGLSNG